MARADTRGGGGAGPHTLDSSVHTDVAAITEQQGQILYWNGKAWTALAPASESGQLLLSQGDEADPAWSEHLFWDAINKILRMHEGATIEVEMAVPTNVAAAPSATAGTLAAGTYYYRVTALDGSGETIGSTEVSATIDGSTNTAVDISWDAVPGAASYRVYGRASDAQDQYWEVTTNSYTDDGTAGTAGTVPTSTTAYVHKIDTSSFCANPSIAYFAGNVGIGTTGPERPLDIVGSAIQLTRIEDSASAAGMFFRKKRITGTGAVQTGDTPGGFDFVSWDGSAWQYPAYFGSIVDGTVATGSVPTAITFVTGTAAGANRSEKMRITSNGNVGIGTTSPGGGTTAGEHVLSLADVTNVPAGGVAGQVSLYSSAGELYAFDSAGNATLLSPHRFDLFEPDSNYEFPFSYYSENYFIGKKVNVDMYGAIRALEQLTGKQFIFVEDLPAEKIVSWDENEELQRIRREKEIEEWQKRKAEYDKALAEYEKLPAEKRKKASPPEPPGEQPKPYVKRTPPKWMAPRLKKTSALAKEVT